MAAASLTFAKGMNTDADKASRDGTSYLRAENYTFTSTDGGTTGALENAKGNELDSSISFATNHEVVGYTNIVDNTVYFTTDGTDSNIYFHEDGTMNLVYSDSASTEKLNFSTSPDDRIIAVGRYESEDVQKVFWVDGVNNIRYANVKDTYTGLSADVFDIVSNYAGVTPNVQEVDGGNFTAGVVQYGYKTYRKNGSISLMSPLSRLIKLAKMNKEGLNIKYSVGSELDEEVNKSVKVDFDLPSTLTDERAYVYRIFYDEVINTPIITLVADVDISVTNSVSFIDNGTIALGTLEIDELVAESRIFKAKALESKNNILFAANIEEDNFDIDFDARAYRFDSSSNARIYENDSTSAGTENYYDISSTGAWNYFVNNSLDSSGTDWSIPETANAKNRYNNFDFDGDSVNPSYTDNIYDYIYKSDGTTLGGEGKNVSYTFSEESQEIGRVFSSDSTRYSDPTLNSVTLTDSYRGYKRGEVYRFGLTFKDKKGRTSFVKWIGDIRIPKHSSTNKYTERNTSAPYDITANFLTVNFEVDLSSLSATDRAKVAFIEIVRVQRKESDFSILGQGSVFSTRYDSANSAIPYFKYNLFGYTSGTALADDYSRKVINFESTDLLLGAFKKDLNNVQLRTYAVFRGDDFTNQYFFRDIIDARILGIVGKNGPDKILEPPTSFSDIHFRNRATTTAFASYGSTSMGITIETELPDLYNTTNYSHYYAEIVRTLYNTQYGGNTYAARTQNEYISASYPVTVTSGVDVYNLADYKGDTFINITEKLQYFVDQAEDATTYDLVHLMPTESYFDQNYVLNKSMGLYTGSAGTKSVAIAETRELGITMWPDTYPEELGDLYRYNSVYSVEQVYPKYYTKPDTFNSVNSQPSLVLASESKLNGEIVDSWTTFLYNNFIEIDTKYGGVNDLLTKDNRLFFWQDTAFGTLAVNDRSLITDATGAQLSLGTGTVLERYDYISNTIGNVDKYSITSNETGMFWVYSPKNMVVTFDNQIKELSTSGGVKKYMLDSGAIIDPISVSDFDSNEVLFKINSEVLVFDVMTSSFTGIYTYAPEWFIARSDGNFYSSGNSIAFYLHNSDNVDRATYYGTTYDSTITHICAHDYASTKMYANLEWHSTSIDSSGINIYGNTFDSYRIYNDYQNTDWQTLTWRRKERGFTTYIPRDRVNAPQSSNVDIFNASNLDNAQTFKRRIRDKYIVLDLTYDNTSGNKFSVPYIIVYYNQSYR